MRRIPAVCIVRATYHKAPLRQRSVCLVQTAQLLVQSRVSAQTTPRSGNYIHCVQKCNFSVSYHGPNRERINIFWNLLRTHISMYGNHCAPSIAVQIFSEIQIPIPNLVFLSLLSSHKNQAGLQNRYATCVPYHLNFWTSRQIFTEFGMNIKSFESMTTPYFLIFNSQ
jgi:hypothetical protein